MKAEGKGLARIEGAARDVLAACARMRDDGEDARILLEAARDVLAYAAELPGPVRSGGDEPEKAQSVPLWVVDGLVCAEEDSADLAQAIACAHEAAQTELADPMEYIPGALAVLLAAGSGLHGRVAGLRREAEEAMA